jgi:hypothetical protein
LVITQLRVIKDNVSSTLRFHRMAIIIRQSAQNDSESVLSQYSPILK